jgi:hypothetical protein
VSLAGEVALVTRAVAGRHISPVDQYEPTADRLGEIGNVRTQSLTDQWKYGPIDP